MAEQPTAWTAEAARRLARERGAVEVADEALRRVAQASVAEAWITVTPADVLRVQAARVDERTAAGEQLPLAGGQYPLGAFGLDERCAQRERVELVGAQGGVFALAVDDVVEVAERLVPEGHRERAARR